jgi:hypothetical protein
MEEVKEYTLEEKLNHVSVWRDSGTRQLKELIK